MYRSILSDIEKTELDKYSKIIIWGFPIHTHTHSYIHAMWYKVFSEGFNKQTYWFDDQNYPTDFDYTNCLFISEGYADKNIQIVESSVYCIHNAIYPEKYLDKGVRLIEIRFNVDEIHDVNNDFKLDDGTHNNIIKISEFAKYEKLYSNKDIHISKRGHTIKNMNYECIYLYWGTDLLPHEFNFDDIYIPKENTVYYIGSPTNSPNSIHFQNICSSNNISWINSNPWCSPISFDHNKDLMKKSILCPDFRPTGSYQDIQEFGIKNGKNHLEIGYLPCRVLKAISYGQRGITDSKYVKEILKEHVVYASNMNELFNIAMNERNDYEKIKIAMEFVQKNFTYVNRAHELIKALCL
jgi:hypothetical protein